MKQIRDDLEALAAHTEAHDGVMLAHTSLMAALIAVLRGKGLLTQDEVNATFDAALLAAENAPEITAEASRRARRILEMMAGEMGGPRA